MGHAYPEDCKSLNATTQLTPRVYVILYVSIKMLNEVQIIAVPEDLY